MMSLLYNSFKIFSHQVVKVRPLLPHTTHLFQDNCFLMVSLYKCLLLGKKAVHCAVTISRSPRTIH